MTSDPESQKRHQAWLDKTTHLPPDPYSTDAVERRAADNLGLFNRPLPPPDPGATKGLAILVLIGGGAALFAAIVVVAYVYDFVRAHPLVTVTGLVVALAFYYLPRRWKIRSAWGAIGFCLAALAAAFVSHSVQQNALAKVNARETDFIAAAEPKFRAIALNAVERGLQRVRIASTVEASTEFRPADRPGALLIITRTMRYGWSSAGHQMNIKLKMSAAISQDDIKKSAPIDPGKISYSQPKLIAEFVFSDRSDAVGRRPRFRNHGDLSAPEKNFIDNEIIARSPIAAVTIDKCQKATTSTEKEDGDVALKKWDSGSAMERNLDGQMRETNFFRCEIVQTNNRNIVRYMLDSYSLIPNS
jgi:hypothetical protein